MYFEFVSEHSANFISSMLLCFFEVLMLKLGEQQLFELNMMFMLTPSLKRSGGFSLLHMIHVCAE